MFSPSRLRFAEPSHFLSHLPECRTTPPSARSTAAAGQQQQQPPPPPPPPPRVRPEAGDAPDGCYLRLPVHWQERGQQQQQQQQQGRSRARRGGHGDREEEEEEAPGVLENLRVVACSGPALSLLLLLGGSGGGGGRWEEVLQAEEGGRVVQALAGNWEVEEKEGEQAELVPVLFHGSTRYAHVYCGHQFGAFAGQLGDGAVVALGEVVDPSLQSGNDEHQEDGQDDDVDYDRAYVRDGHVEGDTHIAQIGNRERWELQLKGSGLTPFSRTADGRKVLRSSLREFLCSEAMHFLGIPTTRAGTLIVSDSTIVRDPLYSGQPQHEKCAVVSRIARSFLRFGSFEICKPQDALTQRAGPSPENWDLLAQLVNYTIDTHFAAVREQHPAPDPLPAGQRVHPPALVAFFEEVVRRTACLVALWQCTGFCHGVLNTDNLSILGLTIDYGPYGFMDTFNRSFVCNGSDDGARYSYENQPAMCKWDCGKLAEALTPLLPPAEATTTTQRAERRPADPTTEIDYSVIHPLLHPALRQIFDAVFEHKYLAVMRRKLGLLRAQSDSDADLVRSLFDVMESTGSDMTNTFRALHHMPFPSDPADVARADRNETDGAGAGQDDDGEEEDNEDEDDAEFNAAVDHVMRQRVSLQGLQATVKPRILAQQAVMALRVIEAEPQMAHMIGVSEEFLREQLALHAKRNSLLKLTDEERDASDRAEWREWLRTYRVRLLAEARALGGDGEPVSREALQRAAADRQRTMEEANPRIVLRNWMAQEVIDAATQGNFDPTRELLRALSSPYGTASTDAASASASADAGVSAGESKAGEQSGLSQATEPLPTGGSKNWEVLPPEWSHELCVTCSS